MRPFLCALLLLFGCALSAQPGGSPEEIVDQFLFADTSDAVPLRGEAVEQFDGPLSLADSQVVSIRPFQMDTLNAAFAVVLAEGEPHDLYVHLSYEDDQWSVSAFRTLWLPGFVYALRDWLVEWDNLKENPERETIMREYLRESMEIVMTNVSSEDVEETLLGLDSMLVDLPNMLLTTASDAVLKAHFLSHIEDFEAIASSFEVDSTLGLIQADNNHASGSEAAKVSERLRQLNLQSANRGSIRYMTYREQSVIFCTVGGMIDNSVGFLFVPEGSRPPPVTPGEFIYVEEIAPGWYIFKTT